jgi:capsular exopolysaccharide synthesis family protein
MAQYELNLRDYLRILRKRKLIVILCPILVMLFSYILTPSARPIFKAVSSLKVTQSSSLAGMIMRAIIYMPRDTLATQSKLIKSQTTMIRVAQRLGKIREDLTDEKILSDKRNLKIINQLSSKINAIPAEQTSIIEINATASNPQEAILLANTTAEVFVQISTYERNRQAIDSRKFIESQLEIYQDKLRKAEQELKEFKEKGIDNINITEAEINKIYSELQEIKSNKEKINQQIVQLERRKNSPKGSNIGWISLDADNPPMQTLNAKLLELQLQKQDLLTKYTFQAPEVVEIEEEIQNLLENILSEYKQQLTSLENTEGFLDRRLKEMPDKAIRLNRFEREVRINEENYSLLKTRYQEALIAEAEKIQEIDVIEKATAAIKLHRSKKGSNSLIGLIIGLLLGFVLSLIVEAMDTSIGTIEDVESFLGIPVLGVVPHLDLRQIKDIIIESNPTAANNPNINHMANLVALFNTKSPVAEAFRSLRTNIEFARMQKPGKLFMLTSSTLQEGKSSTVANLAISFAQIGKKTLILECDWRRPYIYKIFGLKVDSGLTDIILGTSTIQKATYTFADVFLGQINMQSFTFTPGIDNLHIITCGTVPPNPTELLSTNQFDVLLEKLKDSYDIILIDSPPVLPVADATILATKAEGTIMVYKFGKIGRGVLRRAKIHLDNVNANIMGIVLNDIKAEVSGFEPESQYIYKYYKEAEEEEKKAKLINLKKLWQRKKNKKIRIKPSKPSKQKTEEDSELNDLLDITDNS